MRMALPKGRLLEGVLEKLAQVGFGFDFQGPRDYRPTTNAGVEAKLVKARVVPQIVALGNMHAGFCGLDLVRESDYEQVVPVANLGLNRVQIVVAVPHGDAGLLASPPPRPLLIATEYEHLADRWATEHNLAHIILQTHGSTEAYAPEDADIILDCVETGATLAANGLTAIQTLFESTTYMVASRFALDNPTLGPAIRALAARLESEKST